MVFRRSVYLRVRREEGGGLVGLVAERRRKAPRLAVVAREAVDPRLNEDEAELRVLVAAAALKVLANGDCLLNHAVEVLGDLGRKALRLQDADDLRPSDVLDLANRKLVTEYKADPRGRRAFSGELADLLADVLRRVFVPGCRSARVWYGGTRYTLALRVHAAHGFVTDPLKLLCKVNLKL